MRWPPDRSGRSHSFSALISVLRALGLSHRSTEKVARLFGYRVSYTSSWRDARKLGGMARRRLPAGSARVVGVDETWMKVRGKARPVGVALDLGGKMLGVELTGADFDYVGWFKRLSEELGAEVVVTDDARACDEGVEQSGVGRQQCLARLRRGLSRAKSKLSEQLRERYGWLLKEMRQLLRELPYDGAERLLRWARDKELPQELRPLAARLLNRWRQMALFMRVAGAPESTNWVEGKFGRIKPRYRMTRSLKPDAGALSFMSVVCNVPLRRHILA